MSSIKPFFVAAAILLVFVVSGCTKYECYDENGNNVATIRVGETFGALPASSAEKACKDISQGLITVRD